MMKVNKRLVFVCMAEENMLNLLTVLWLCGGLRHTKQGREGKGSTTGFKDFIG